MSTGIEKIVILDFGSQYTQLIARRVREQNVFSEILHYAVPAAELRQPSIRGIILSGGPASVYEEGAPHPDPAIFSLGIPILGICYGMQLMAYHLSGEVDRSGQREYGHASLTIREPGSLFDTLDDERTDCAPGTINVWMSHGDKLTALPAGFVCRASTRNSMYAAIEDTERRFYGLQFHPEVVHTPLGHVILRNFIRNVCGCQATWTMEAFIQSTIRALQQEIGQRQVLCALSGGVDSSVLAVLLHKAVGERCSCIFVDNGLLRKGERDSVEQYLASSLNLNVRIIDARRRFLDRLENIADPEQKRRIIGDEFIKVFFDNAGEFHFLAQGTLYPDVIESTSTKGPSATIKTHHNRVPEIMALIEQGRIIEPLKNLFKDEVREVGLALGLPEEIVYRHPFPGPGLAIRCIGPVAEDRLRLLREADAIVREEIVAAGLHRHVWQAFAVLLPVQSVGVMGDLRTYENSCVIRVVNSQDAMTADWTRLPYDVLAGMSHRIINEIKGINRVMYDISSKPPATIEWE